MSELKAFPLNISGDIQTSVTMGAKDLINRLEGKPIRLDSPQDQMDLYVAFDDIGLSPSTQYRAIGTIERVTDIVKRSVSFNKRRFWLPDSLVVVSEREGNGADIDGLGVVTALSNSIVMLKSEGAKKTQGWEIGPDKLLILAGKGDVQVKTPSSAKPRRKESSTNAEALVISGKVARF